MPLVVKGTIKTDKKQKVKKEKKGVIGAVQKVLRQR